MSVLFTLLFACSDKTSEKSTVVEKPAGQEVSKAKKPESVSTVKSKSAPSKPATFDPLKGKSIQDICASYGLSLIKWSYEDRQSKHQELCCGEGGFPEDADECIFDWPSSDVPPCSIYDEMRNEIFAQYGRSFKTEQWQTHFANQDWYQIRENYSDEWLSPVAQANVKSLIEKKVHQVGCMD